MAKWIEKLEKLKNCHKFGTSHMSHGLTDDIF